MTAAWTYELAMEWSQDRYSDGLFREEQEEAFWEELEDEQESLSYLGSIPSITVGHALIDEIVMQAKVDPKTAKQKLHQWWRYECLNWQARIESVEGRTKKSPGDRHSARVPKLDSQDLNGVLMLSALSTSIGKDASSQYFSNWCINALEHGEHMIEVDACRTGSVEPFLMFLFAMLAGKPADKFVPNQSPFREICDGFLAGELRKEPLNRLVELHCAKACDPSRPDDDYVFGLQVGIARIIPIELRLIMRVANDLGVRVEPVDHPFVESPISALCEVGDELLADRFFEAAFQKCKTVEATFELPVDCPST